MKKCSNENSEKQLVVESRITYWMKKERNSDENVKMMKKLMKMMIKKKL